MLQYLRCHLHSYIYRLWCKSTAVLYGPEDMELSWGPNIRSVRSGLMELLHTDCRDLGLAIDRFDRNSP